jgi:thiol-disulfide isomerase/thioredoxin
LLVTTQRSLALRCPLCGRLEFNQLSLFDFSGRSQVRINCECGFKKMVLSTKNFKDYFLQVPCLICDQIHLLKFTHHELWEKPVVILRCAETAQELGYMGEAESLEKLVRRKQNDVESIVNNYGFDDYFTNPQVMFEVLNHLHQIAEEEHLFCMCGNNNIEIDVFPEKLELQCPHCQSIHIIYAETMEDLKIVKQVKVIAMTEKGFTSFDSSKVHPNLNS